MKVVNVNVTELKVRLSKYLRMASRGTRIIVKDRTEPIAELGPLQREPLPWHDRLAREGRLRRGSQNWDRLSISPLERPVDIQASLLAVREESDEVRRR
jgi:antitoxin (DNA-binding transcriptional repressor) of toxin-antitoxin stability system